MATGSARLIVAIVTDAKKASKDLDATAEKFGKFGAGLTKLAAPAAVALAGVTAFGVAGVNAASDLQQAMGGVDAVFGDSASTIKEWSAEASAAVGLSSAEYSTFAAQIGAQLKNLGVPFDEVAGNTNDLIKLGADLAATYGGTTAEAVAALSSALRGEADPAERYGLALNATAVNAELAAQGLSGLEGDALTSAKAQTIMALATEQAGDAVGQFGRESDTVAGQQQRLTAAMTDASAELGTALLPAISAVTGFLADMAKWIQQNSAVIGPLIAVVGGLAAGILAANAAMSAWGTIQTVVKGITVAYTAVQAALNAVMAANPIGIIILAVLALVAAFVWLWNNVEGFRNFFIGVWEVLQAAVAAVVEWFKSAWAAVSAWFKSVWTAVAAFFKGLWAGIKSVVAAVGNFFKSLWSNVTSFVRGVFVGFGNIVKAVLSAIRGVVSRVASFFKSIWNTAVGFVKRVITNLKAVFTSVFNAIMVPINAVSDAFATVVGWIQDVISWLGKIKVPDVFGGIASLFGASSTQSVQMTTASTFGAGSARLSSAARAGVIGSGSPNITINVTGGLDSGDAIARNIERVLRRRERRSGGLILDGR